MNAARPRAWRLLPSETVVWLGGPKVDVPRDLRWTVVPALFVSMSAVAALFAGLMWISGIEAVRSTALLSFYLLLSGIAIYRAPRHLLDPCEFMVTDRQVIWKRGNLRRTIDRRSITYARIHWHRSVAGVGHLELVRAVPFGPLARKQRVLLHDIEGPDVLFALIREANPAPHAGYSDVQLTDRLDAGEIILWGAAPAGWRLGQAEAVTAFVGLAVLAAGVIYAYKTGGVLVGLEDVGLPVQSWTWLMLFLAIAISGSVILTVGAFLFWFGLWGARADGSQTEYILTDSRLLIRRGRIELSLDRRSIVDIAVLPSSAGSRNLHLILDAPHARALADSGALSMFAPPRATVPPVLYEVREMELIRNLILERRSDPRPPLAA